MQPSKCLAVEVKGCAVGCEYMFRSKKSRKNILGLLEALQIQQKKIFSSGCISISEKKENDLIIPFYDFSDLSQILLE